MNRYVQRSTLAILCLAFAATAATSAAAGPGKHRDGGRWEPPGAEERVAWMTEQLDLDDDQSTRLLAVLQQADQEREALREQFEAEMKPEICALHERATRDIREILDAEQAAEFDEMLERRADFAERRGRRGPPLPSDC